MEQITFKFFDIDDKFIELHGYDVTKTIHAEYCRDCIEIQLITEYSVFQIEPLAKPRITYNFVVTKNDIIMLNPAYENVCSETQVKELFAITDRVRNYYAILGVTISGQN